jgi:mono/diheme cytochrome c family protein
MNRFARSPLLALPGILFIALTHTVPALEPSVEAAGEQQPLQLDPARAALMKAHYHEAIAVQDAVIRGDLSAATPAAAALAKAPTPTGLPAAAVPHAAALKAAAGRAAAATTLSAASNEVASMFTTCGACHAAAGTRPGLPVPSPSAAGGVVGHMLAHQRAVDQMLQGLVLPSAALWRQGAEGLKAAPLRRSELPRDSALTRDVIAAEQRVHRMADQAAATNDPAIRARQYAEILTTCAECHSTHRKVWGPSGVRPAVP